MANSPNLKVNVTADTSSFQKGMKSSKTAVRDFERTSSQALGKLGEAFGINTRAVEQTSNAIKGMGIQLSQAGNTGASALGKIITAAGAAGTAFAAIGIGAAVAGFKQLTAEAANFKSTVAGANIELQTQAYITTYQQVLHDMNSETGKSVAETEAKVKKAWARIKATVGAGAVSIMGNLMEGDGLFSAIKNGVNDTSNALDDANSKAEKAAKLQGEIYDLQRKQSDALVTVAELDAQIAEARERAANTELSNAERLAANLRAQELIRQKYALQAGLATQIANKQQEMLNLAGSTQAQVDAVNQALAASTNYRKQEADEIRSLERQQGTLTKATQAEAAAAAQLLESRKALASLSLSVSDNAKALSGASTLATTEGGGLAMPIKPVVDKRAMDEAIKQMQALIEDAISSTSTMVGELIGDLVTGGDAWTNFANSAMSAFGDMAIQVGKMAIATGVATLGIKKALTSLNGGVAIAAGAALVALGSAVKAGLSNVAGGSYSANTGVASSAASSYSSNSSYAMREMNVTVTGTLKASGSQLVAVLNNESNRKNHTT